jgi:hypothetical protein
MNDLSPNRTDELQKRIYTLRGVQVMVDEELTELYGVETKRLNEQVKRNIDRFPSEFMFQVSEAELDILRSQIATSSGDSLRSQIVTLSWGGRRYLPYVFTEQGIAMLSAVLKSETAINVSIQIMSAFVAMRRFLQSNAHDRFLILDEKTVYHFGASLKDLGKKWLAFSKLRIDSVGILDKLKVAGVV